MPYDPLAPKTEILRFLQRPVLSLETDQEMGAHFKKLVCGVTSDYLSSQEHPARQMLDCVHPKENRSAGSNQWAYSVRCNLCQARLAFAKSGRARGATYEKAPPMPQSGVPSNVYHGIQIAQAAQTEVATRAARAEGPVQGSTTQKSSSSGSNLSGATM